MESIQQFNGLVKIQPGAVLPHHKRKMCMSYLWLLSKVGSHSQMQSLLLACSDWKPAQFTPELGKGAGEFCDLRCCDPWSSSRWYHSHRGVWMEEGSRSCCFSFFHLNRYCPFLLLCGSKPPDSVCSICCNSALVLLCSNICGS